MDGTTARRLIRIYHRLYARYGPQYWWPARGPFEVIVGAVLTQNTAWTNVEKAIENLRQASSLTAAGLRRLTVNELAALIHPCGYYNVKAGRLMTFVSWFGEQYGDSLEAMFAGDTDELRRELLAVPGVGEETADSILLYAGEKPVFVIDAYTRRIFARLGLTPQADSYAAWQSLFTDNLSAEAPLFNEYHALLVRLGKEVCRQRPRCIECCLKEDCLTADSQKG